MIPEKKCSALSIAAKYKGADMLPYTDTCDFEEGPIHLQDPSQGLQYQIWRARIVADTVYITSATKPETPVITVRGIQEVSLAFDQNARYVVLYLVQGNMWLYWHDPAIQQYTHTLLETGVISPRASLDDKREMQRDNSEIILAYVKDGNLYYRGQRDRYQIPHLLQTGVAGRLMRVGMNANYRLQFIFQAQPYDIYSCTLELNCL